MNGSFAGAPSRGVSTLMYVGDDAVGAPPAVTNRQLGIGALGALAAIFSKSTLIRIAGAGVAAYTGVLARKAGVI